MRLRSSLSREQELDEAARRRSFLEPKVLAILNMRSRLTIPPVLGKIWRYHKKHYERSNNKNHASKDKGHSFQLWV
jgi:hypothetical protein